MLHRTKLLWAVSACFLLTVFLFAPIASASARTEVLRALRGRPESKILGLSSHPTSETGGISGLPTTQASPPPVATLPQQADLIGTLAVAPAAAPEPIKEMIAAGNRIRHKPYLWGGGHRGFNSRGYDCSGSVSYLLHAAGLLTTPMDSSQLMHWGQSGPGNWVSVFSNPGHAFIVVAGLRFDTGYVDHGAGSGPRWSETPRPEKGYTVRHPEL